MSFHPQCEYFYLITDNKVSSMGMVSLCPQYIAPILCLYLMPRYIHIQCMGTLSKNCMVPVAVFIQKVMKSANLNISFGRFCLT